MINFKTYFSEALSLKTAKKYTKMSPKKKYKQFLGDVFGNEYRIYIPLDLQRKDLKTTPLIKKIKTYIENDKKVPIEEFDYLGGYVTSKKNKLKIGRLIKDNEKLARAFEQDPLRASKDLQIVISKHPYDIAGMSTDRGWASCMAIPDKLPEKKKTTGGKFNMHVEDDIQQGTLIAYLISNKDRNINNPLSRVLLKPYQNVEGEVAYGVGQIYGISNKFFKNKVQEWVNENLNKNLSDDVYLFNQKLYSDGDDSEKIIFGKKFKGSKMINDDGNYKWYNNKGQLHREDGPAVEWADGTKSWLINGKLHRKDGPAVERAQALAQWYINDKLHREDGPAVVSGENKEWWLNGKPHREDGPAIERAGGTKKWFLNGKQHREDGPAVEKADGTKEWWLNDREYYEEEEYYEELKKRGIKTK